MTKYIITDESNDTRQEFESADAAAHEILTEDGYEYAICKESNGYRLFHSNRSRSGLGEFKLNETVIFSAESDEEKARAEIFRKVCEQSQIFATDSDTLTLEIID